MKNNENDEYLKRLVTAAFELAGKKYGCVWIPLLHGEILNEPAEDDEDEYCGIYIYEESKKLLRDLMDLYNDGSPLYEIKVKINLPSVSPLKKYIEQLPNSGLEYEKGYDNSLDIILTINDLDSLAEQTKLLEDFI